MDKALSEKENDIAGGYLKEIFEIKLHSLLLSSSFRVPFAATFLQVGRGANEAKEKKRRERRRVFCPNLSAQVKRTDDSGGKRKEGEGRAEKEIQTVSKKKLQVAEFATGKRSVEFLSSFFIDMLPLHFAQYHSTEHSPDSFLCPSKLELSCAKKVRQTTGCVCRRNVGFGATFGVGYENETQERRR